MADDVLMVDRKEAARRLGLGVRMVWELTNTGELPAVRFGRAVRYRVADLEAFTAGRTPERYPGVPLRRNPAG